MGNRRISTEKYIHRMLELRRKMASSRLLRRSSRSYGAIATQSRGAAAVGDLDAGHRRFNVDAERERERADPQFFLNPSLLGAWSGGTGRRLNAGSELQGEGKR